MRKIQEIWNKKPLVVIIALAILFRLLATFFSQGYGFHDDHFVVVEAPQAWVDGTDYNDYLPQYQLEINPDQEPTPEGHSLFYLGINYVILEVLEQAGITYPKTKMYFMRFLHALFSLLIVTYGYKLAKTISDEKNAREVGLLLAILWFMPFFSVRNMVEIVCIPLLIMPLYYLYKDKISIKYLLLAGFLAGLSFSVRYQTALFIGGIGLVLLIQKKWKEVIWFSTGTILSITLVQGLIDFFVWDKPFAELIEYVRYNLRHKTEYGSNQYSMYFLVIWGLLLPPISFLWTIGFFKNWKKHLLIVLPTLIFFAFHTYFPNKQERFIIPVIPIIVILGIVGWNEILNNSQFWKKYKVFYKSLYALFWVLNIALLVMLTFTYSKKSRVEAMVYLSQKDDVEAILCEDINAGSVASLPMFYLDDWVSLYRLPRENKNLKDKEPDQFHRNSRYVKIIKSYEFFELRPEFVKPNYFMFYADKDLDARIRQAREYFPDLKYQATIEPGFVDYMMWKINPTNANKTIYVYKTMP